MIDMSMNKEFPTVLIPIEIGTRELTAKLALASALATEGFRSVVGHKEAIESFGRESKCAIWHGKCYDRLGSEHLIIDFLVKNESAVTAHDEEGGIYPQDKWEDSVLENIQAHALKDKGFARICLWGKMQKEVLVGRAPELGKVLTVTGSPRFDLCSPNYAWIDDIGNPEDRARRMPYILVNTRFAGIVHTLGPEDWFRRNLSNGPRLSTIDRENVFSTWHRDAWDFADMMQLIKELALGYPNYTVVLRPHPSESLNFYKEAFSTFENIYITRDHSVLYWSRYADLVVHNKCTTGVEAVLSGRPVLHFWPRKERELDVAEEVAREAGVTVSSCNDALDVASSLLAGRVPPQNWSRKAIGILNNLRAPAIPLLVREIFDVATEMNIHSSTLSSEWLKADIRRKSDETAEDRYVISKRNSMPDHDYIQAVMDGCRSRNLGSGKVSHLDYSFVIIEPT
jgi:surface carbohydrate biosynthesis protein